MSPDQIYDGGKEGFGLYTYCRNNPLVYHDPSGLESKNLLDKAKDFVSEKLKQANEFKDKIIKKAEFQVERIEYIVKYHNSSIKKGKPMKEGSYRITDDNNDSHKARTVGGVQNNKFVSDYGANIGTPVYTTGKTNFKTNAQRWSYDDSSFSEKTILGGTYNTQGTGYGFRINGTLKEGNLDVWYGHGNPNSQVAKDFDKLQSLAKSAGYQQFSLPQGTQIMESGNTGHSTGPHLHYEENYNR